MGLLDEHVGDIAREIPGATSIFHKHRLDFCCGGAKRLRDALESKGIAPEGIVRELERMRGRGVGEKDWRGAETAGLIEHILSRYHDVHRQQLPELIRLATRVERVHGGHPQCPASLTHHLQLLANELDNHMLKEEEVLFPMISRGMLGMAAGPAGVMRTEHEDHGQALERIAALTSQYQLPEGACGTWTALYRGLENFRDDLMNHIHLENNILFQRVDGGFDSDYPQ